MSELSSWGLAQSVAETLVLLVLVPLAATVSGGTRSGQNGASWKFSTMTAVTPPDWA